jgi:Beta-galactosidase
MNANNPLNFVRNLKHQKQSATRLCRMPALLGALLCAAGLLAIPGKALAQAQKPYPAGIIWLPNADTVEKPLGDLSRQAEWTYPFVDGIRLRSGWNVVQPQSSSYDWSTIDQALSLAAQNGMRVGVSISAGIATPRWVYDNGATRYQLLDRSGNSMPIPWEPAYVNQWLAFVRTFGARYDRNPALAYVIITGFMQTNGMFLAGGADEINLSVLAVRAGYPDLSTAYLFAAERITSAIMDAFPTTACIITMQAPFPDLGDLQGTVSDWGVATYPGRFGTMSNWLTAVPAPHAPPPPPVPYPFGYQMICPANKDPATLYQDPDPVPMPPPPTPLRDALETGVSSGAQYVEVYKSDLELAIDWQVFAAEGVKLKANLP